MRNKTASSAARRRLLVVGAALSTLLGSGFATDAAAHGAIGPQRHIVMRVDFADSGTTTPRYTRQQVENLLVNVTDLFTKISNGNVQAQFVVTDVFRLPGNAADYNGAGQINKTINDALAAAPPAVTALWGNDVHAVIVLLSRKWDAGGSFYTTRNVGQGGAGLFVGNAVIGENPGDSDLAVWGRWAHEVGHNMQVGGGPAHPSAYQSNFDLMDANYPGRIGPVSLQDYVQHPHWLAPAKYQTFTPALGGGTAAIWAVEHDQNLQPNTQAVKVEIANKQYYMVSVRRRVRGDELNANFQTAPAGQRGIPDEGVMIERVDEVTNSNHWVTVVGRNRTYPCTNTPSGCNRDQLWKEGDRFTSSEVTIEVTRKVDDDNYLVRVIYNDVGQQPDVMINPWLSPPGNTWETTDIWVDSPVNGFGTFRYGMHDDGTGQMVPVGNGDDPAINQTNRVYARIRNVGRAPASNVVATIEVTDPLGMGIMPTTQWALVGTVDSTAFPGLASIPAGGFVDVYADWKPTPMLTPAQTKAGVFYFHSCLRVRLAAVAGETVLANQDGDREQENIAYFEVAPTGTKKPHKSKMSVHNTDPRSPLHVILGHRLEIPQNGAADWRVEVNGGVNELTLQPGELREIPIEVVPGPLANVAGQAYTVDVFSLVHAVLVNDQNKKDYHNEFRKMGGARLQGMVVNPTHLDCTATVDGEGRVSVAGRMRSEGDERLERQPIMAIGATAAGAFVESTRALLPTDADGRFSGVLKTRPRDAIRLVECQYAGTTTRSSARQVARPKRRDSNREHPRVP